MGLRAEAIPLDELRAFQDLRTVHHVACRLTGLEILDLLGMPAELIPWHDLELLCVGEVPAEPAHHQQTGLFTVIPSARHISDVVTDVPTHPIELWIACRKPERVDRLDASKLNFGSLVERKTNSMRINLRLLLEQIVRQPSNVEIRHRRPPLFESPRGQHTI